MFVLFALSACSNDDDLTNQNLDPITYTDDVKVIIDNNCLSCHSDPTTNGATISLVTFAQVKNSAENGPLISRIEIQAGQSGAMPDGGPRLSQSLIDVIVQWREDGFID